MLVTSVSHMCCSLASTKAYPCFRSHSWRPRSIQMLTSPTSPLDEMLFRNHCWNTDGLQGEPPQQLGGDRWKEADDDQPTCHRLERAPVWSLNPRLLPALRLPLPPNPKQTTPVLKLPRSLSASGQNPWNLRTPNARGIGYTRQSDAHVTKRHDLVARQHQSGCRCIRSSRAHTCTSPIVTLVETQATWSTLFSFRIPSSKNQNRMSSTF